jgi:hypothetical protein
MRRAMRFPPPDFYYVVAKELLAEGERAQVPAALIANANISH